MILVDTSVWIEAFRRGTGSVAASLREVLDADQATLAAPVRIEILTGSSAADLPRLRRVLSALPLVYPSPDTWALMEAWALRSVSAGQRFGVADLLIAALASENDHQVWSLDSDFRRMAALGFIRLRSA